MVAACSKSPRAHAVPPSVEKNFRICASIPMSPMFPGAQDCRAHFRRLHSAYRHVVGDPRLRSVGIDRLGIAWTSDSRISLPIWREQRLWRVGRFRQPPRRSSPSPASAPRHGPLIKGLGVEHVNWVRCPLTGLAHADRCLRRLRSRRNQRFGFDPLGRRWASETAIFGGNTPGSRHHPGSRHGPQQRSLLV